MKKLVLSKGTVLFITALGVLLLLIIVLSLTVSPASAANLCIDEYYASLTDDDYKNSFLDESCPYRKEIFEVIQKNGSISLNKASYNGDLSHLQFTVSLDVPSFAASVNKKFPQLFTYANENYYSSKMNVMSEEEYLSSLFELIIEDLSVSSTTYHTDIQLSAYKMGKKWAILSTEELENHILGNIYSYQNDDVRFLTYSDLFMPSKNLKTTTAEVSSLFDVTSADVAFSSPEVPVPAGDTARFPAVLPDGTGKYQVNLTMASSHITPEGEMVIEFKGSTLEEGTSFTVFPSMFETRTEDDTVITPQGVETVITAEPSSFTLIFPAASELVIFKSEEIDIFFSTEIEK